MISTRNEKGRWRAHWPAIGAVCLALGMAAIVVGVPWTWLTDENWPWTETISHTDSGVEVEISHPAGRTEVFRATTEAEANAWRERRDRELMHTYHLDTRIAAGRVLSPLGFGLAAAGCGILVWRPARVVRRRRSHDTAES